MTQNVPITVSLPLEILARMDREKGDLSRSRFVLRAIEKSLGKDTAGAVDATPVAAPPHAESNPNEGGKAA
ncbi:MAG: hypothetical protein ABSF83_09220 [Nitrososphaerales archaeon]|jgi:metal-responsive CopG/Arc/MetJ family transcriptional regulator